MSASSPSPIDLDDLSISEAEEAGVLDEYTGDADEEWQTCCPDPITAARRLCGCGGQPYL